MKKELQYILVIVTCILLGVLCHKILDLPELGTGFLFTVLVFFQMFLGIDSDNKTDINESVKKEMNKIIQKEQDAFVKDFTNSQS